jgi:hypothetical protein
MMQLYTGYGSFPIGYGQVGADAVKVGATTVGTGASAAGAVSSLMVAAGGSAAIPVAGWVAAGVLAAAAGTVALVAAIKGGKKRRAEAIAEAQRLGIPNAADVPGYVTRAMKWNTAKLRKELVKARRKLGHKRKGGRAWQKWKSRRMVLRALLALSTGKSLNAATQEVAQETVAVNNTPPPTPAAQAADWILPLGLGFTVLLAGFLATRPS